MKILLVCLGNICRSPAAEAALRVALTEAGLDGRVEVDSAGTGDWHVGEPPDRRMVAAARGTGLELEGTARRVNPDDFDRFDLILAMDVSNLRTLRALAPSAEARAKVRLFREFEEAAGAQDGAPEGAYDEAHDEAAGAQDVPDPYYGGSDGFQRVLDIVQAGARGIVAHVRRELADRP